MEFEWKNVYIFSVRPSNRHIPPMLAATQYRAQLKTASENPDRRLPMVNVVFYFIYRTFRKGMQGQFWLLVMIKL